MSDPHARHRAVGEGSVPTSQRKSLTVRLTEQDHRRFAIALAVNGDKAQDVLERAVLDYIFTGDDQAQ